MTEPTKSLAELLSEPDTINEEFSCMHCGHTQKEHFQRCPQCSKWAEYPTLGEWGKQLPIGIEVKDKLIKSFDIQPLDFKKEREINRQWGARRASLTLSEYMGTILANTVTQIGVQDITKFKLDKRLLVFNQMYQADVFYIYAYLRLISLGHELRMSQIQCPSCAHRFQFSADLRSLEVGVIGTPEELVNSVELKNGFDLNGQNRTKLKIKPPLWNMMASVFGSANSTEADMFESMMMNCVVEVEGMPPGTVLTSRELDQFTALDVAICQDVLSSTLAGPRWEVEGECPRCKKVFYDLVDWTYDGFFALSSRSQRPRRRSRR